MTNNVCGGKRERGRVRGSFTAPGTLEDEKSQRKPGVSKAEG